MNPDLAKFMRADPIAAVVCLAVILLGAAHLPERMHLSPEQVTTWGGIAVALAGVLRLLVKRGGTHDWIGIALGVVAAALGFEGTAVDQLDPNTVAMIGASGGFMAAMHRTVTTDPEIRDDGATPS